MFSQWFDHKGDHFWATSCLPWWGFGLNCVFYCMSMPVLASLQPITYSSTCSFILLFSHVNSGRRTFTTSWLLWMCIFANDSIQGYKFSFVQKHSSRRERPGIWLDQIIFPSGYCQLTHREGYLQWNPTSNLTKTWKYTAVQTSYWQFS